MLTRDSATGCQGPYGPGPKWARDHMGRAQIRPGPYGPAPYGPGPGQAAGGRAARTIGVPWPLVVTIVLHEEMGSSHMTFAENDLAKLLALMQMKLGMRHHYQRLSDMQEDRSAK